MSFICGFCKKSQPTSVTPVRVIVETRQRIYNEGGGTILGSEIVKEKMSCASCVPDQPGPSSVVFSPTLSVLSN